MAAGVQWRDTTVAYTCETNITGRRIWMLPVILYSHGGTTCHLLIDRLIVGVGLCQLNRTWKHPIWL